MMINMCNYPRQCWIFNSTYADHLYSHMYCFLKQNQGYSYSYSNIAYESMIKLVSYTVRCQQICA